LIPPREVCDFCTPAPCLCLCGRRHGIRIRSVLETPSLYFSRYTDSFIHLHNSLSTLENTRIPLLQLLTEGRTGSATRISDRRRPRIRGDLFTAQLAHFSNPLPNHALHNPHLSNHVRRIRIASWSGKRTDLPNQSGLIGLLKFSLFLISLAGLPRLASCAFLNFSFALRCCGVCTCLLSAVSLSSPLSPASLLYLPL
jgi:hypothetical protein